MGILLLLLLLNNKPSSRSDISLSLRAFRSTPPPQEFRNSPPVLLPASRSWNHKGLPTFLPQTLILRIANRQLYLPIKNDSVSGATMIDPSKKSYRDIKKEEKEDGKCVMNSSMVRPIFSPQVKPCWMCWCWALQSSPLLLKTCCLCWEP